MTRFSRENPRWLCLFPAHVGLLEGLPERLYFILLPEENAKLTYYNAQVVNRNIEEDQTPVALHSA